MLLLISVPNKMRLFSIHTHDENEQTMGVILHPRDWSMSEIVMKFLKQLQKSEILIKMCF